jgi:hypothetical protein
VHIPYSMYLTEICAISHIDQNMKLGQWFQSSSALQSVNWMLFFVRWIWIIVCAKVVVHVFVEERKCHECWVCTAWDVLGCWVCFLFTSFHQVLHHGESSLLCPYAEFLQDFSSSFWFLCYAVCCCFYEEC